MPERTPIPADLRRQVLLEAGHRCAIHTCRHVDVDVHHIVPWAQCGEHRLENLIALCPNCHRRAERGDIDRKSLRLYKARLAAAFRFHEVNLYPEESVLPTAFAWIAPTGEWTTKTITKELNQIEVGFEYPNFGERSLGSAASSVNDFIETYVNTAVQRFIGEAGDLAQTASPAPWFLQSSFSVSLIRVSIVSVRFTLTSYTGGAHGAHWTEPLNLWTRPVRAFGIDELFTDPAVGVSGLSEYATAQLLASVDGGPTRDESWVRLGAGPEAKNFKSFSLTSRGILLTFDEYQVGSYAEGASEVHVPYDVMKRQLIPTLAREVLGDDDA